MNLVVGDLWDELGKADLLLVSGNATVKRNGELVMGRGAAREAAQRFPGLALDMGQRIRNIGGYFRQPARYGVLLASDAFGTKPRLGLFQAKWHWRDDASPYLIECSAVHLIGMARNFVRIVLNYPGIGNGRLRVEDVEPIVAALPDNVFIYRKR